MTYPREYRASRVWCLFMVLMTGLCFAGAGFAVAVALWLLDQSFRTAEVVPLAIVPAVLIPLGLYLLADTWMRKVVLYENAIEIFSFAGSQHIPRGEIVCCRKTVDDRYMLMLKTDTGTMDTPVMPHTSRDDTLETWLAAFPSRV